MPAKLQGLIAAAHTPFAPDGSLNPSAIERQARHLLDNKVTTVFIGGSTGESHSLTVEERLRLATRWFEVARGTPMKIVVHVGHNCLADARKLAEQAQQLGAAAVSALSPSYFKPANVDTLVDCCAHVAEAAPGTPFYFYDIPGLTGVSLPMPDFLPKAAERIRTLAGVKFTNPDFVAYQVCRALDNGRFDILWGLDEMLLPALACGAEGAIGSTYNFGAPIYHRLIDAFQRNDLSAARKEQLRSIQLIATLNKRGFVASAKAMMGMLGVDVGPPRLPIGRLDDAQINDLRQELETSGFCQ